MFRGSTPTHTFTIPFSEEQISDIKVCYAQAKIIYLEKVPPDVTINGNEVSVTLTREETEMFVVNPRIPVTKIQAQIIITTESGQRIPSEYIEITLQETLEGV